MDGDRGELFRTGIELFNRQEFFQCHEVLEELWTVAKQPERLFLQALIHFAVGLYHHQRGNAAGAARQLAKGLRKIEVYLPEWGSVRVAHIEWEARRCLAVVEGGGRITDFPRIEQFAPYRPERVCGSWVGGGG